jgi:dephospho-CoA kinase
MLTFEDLQKKYGIGLTGGIACGKSQVASLLRKLGFPVIDADALSRKSLEPGTKWLAQVVAVFGGSVLHEDGTLNRQKMRSLVFSNSDLRKRLEAIVHPAVYELLARELSGLDMYQRPRPWFFEVPLLVESGTHYRYRSIWVVQCSPAAQIQRLIQRDKIDPALAEKIIKSQADSKARAAVADVVIDTSGNIDELETKVKLALEQTKLS